MALVLVKEDGTGLANANSYASAADGDTYHAGHSYATAWTSATTGNKETALVMATRLIDAGYQFVGFKSGTIQALQWPRRGAVDPDRFHLKFSVTSVAILASQVGPYFDYTAVPKVVSDATCEQARELLVLDRTAAPQGEGLQRFYLAGLVTLFFNPKDRLPVISRLVQTMLSKVGNCITAGSGSARLVRT